MLALYRYFPVYVVACTYQEYHLPYCTKCYHHVQVALAVDDTKAIHNRAHMSKIEIQVCMVGTCVGWGRG